MPAPVDDQALLDALRRVQEGLEEKHDDREPTEIIESVGEDKIPPSNVHTAVPSVVTASNFLQHPDAHPLVLDLLLLRHYGPEWLDWSTETIEMRVPDDFHQSSLSSINMTKIQAVKALHLVDTFWEDWEVFLWCTMALNGIFPDFETMQVPTVAQCLVSVDIANRLRGDMEWGDEVKLFLTTCYRHDAILTPLSPTTFISIPRDPELPCNFEEVERRWSTVRSSEHAPVGTTAEDEQLRRMLIAQQYLEESRHRLRLQLPMVTHV